MEQRSSPEPPSPTTPAPSRRRAAALRALLVVAALASAWLSQRLAGDRALMRHPAAALVAFAAALVLVGEATRRPDERPRPDPASRWPRWEMAAVAGMFLAALLVRALHAGEIPPALSGDEGGAGRTAVDILEGRLDNPFVVGWFSFPSLYFFIPAVSIATLGASFEALRLPSAIAGALTVVALYALGRSMWDRRTGAIAALLLVSSHTHLHFSRVGLNNVWDGLLATVAFGLFWRGWSTGRRADFVAAGLTIGLGQYFYASGRLVPAILAAWLVLAAVTDRQTLRARAGGLLALLVVAVVAFLPLGAFFVQHPDEFAAPMNRVTILGGWLENEVRVTGEPAAKILLRTFGMAASGFTVNPVGSWYFPERPLLLPLPAFLFHLGLLLAAARLRDPRPRLLLLWLLGVVCVGALTDSPPAGQRYVVALPAAALLAAWALSTVAARTDLRWPRARLVTAAAVGVILAASAAMDLHFYFRRYVHSPVAVDPNTELAGTLSLRLRGEPPGTPVFFFGPPRMAFASNPTLPFLAPQVVPTDVADRGEGLPGVALAGPRTLFVFLPERRTEVRQVRAAHPGGVEEETLGRDGKVLFSIYVATPPR